MRSLVLDPCQLIKNSNDNIEKNIEILCPDHVGLCAQNILSQSRNLVEAIALLQYSFDNPGYIPENGHKYIETAINDLNQKDARFKPFIKLHNYLQIIASHYTQDQFNSEALLIKYSNLLFDVKTATKDIFNIEILKNIKDFPFSDKREEEFYSEIKRVFNSLSFDDSGPKNTYYIEKKIRRKFELYEYVLSPANDKRTKFDRLTAYSSIDISERHSIECSFIKHKLTFRGITTYIFFIAGWRISIRPCELNKLAFIQNYTLNIKRNSPGYAPLMAELTSRNCSLFDFINSDNFEADLEKLEKPENRIYSFLKLTHKNINSLEVGANVLKYLLFICRHEIIKKQITNDADRYLGNTRLDKGCYAFDTKPYSLSLIKHNPKIEHLFECLPHLCTNEELLKRILVTNTEDRKMLYTPLEELNQYYIAEPLIDKFNKQLNEKTKDSTIEKYGKYVYIRSYEEHTLSILKILKEKENIIDNSYAALSKNYIENIPPNEIDEEKIAILKSGFSNSSVLLINGAAGTGKTTLIKHFSNIFHNEKILFLTCTNSSVQNLNIKVGKATNHLFLTLERFEQKFKRNPTQFDKFTVLVIDECSMTDNETVDFIFKNKDFCKILLVGDERQIESIKFGNWFGIANKLLTSKFELTYNHRTTDRNLKYVWDIVRDLEKQDEIVEKLTSATYHHELNGELFTKKSDDEIILCLNYDGLYGINSINKNLQELNPNPSVSWKVWTFKAGDKILFNESYYFREYFYNNQKGIIEKIDEKENQIIFGVSVDHELTNNQGFDTHIKWIEEKDGRDYYKIIIDKDDDDDEDGTSTKVLVVPFQLGYAISIHKSQGLEYDSVKIVMTREVQEQITHNIFYTAITRAKRYLSIYCDKESLNYVVEHFKKQTSDTDAIIIKRKYFPNL